jgi:hypothetical protein
MNNAIKPNDLLSLEKYDKQREAIRSDVMEYKKNRRLDLGENLALYFESETTMRYQIQEILRAEKVFDEAGILEELEAYNPLIPDGSNLKATMMVQYEEVEERQIMLTRLLDIEHKVWLQVEGNEKVYAIADEDLQRSTDEKTSAVHFLRYEFSDQMIADAKKGKKLLAGVEHPAYEVEAQDLPGNIQESLVSDFK